MKSSCIPAFERTRSTDRFCRRYEGSYLWVCGTHWFVQDLGLVASRAIGIAIELTYTHGDWDWEQIKLAQAVEEAMGAPENLVWGWAETPHPLTPGKARTGGGLCWAET